MVPMPTDRVDDASTVTAVSGETVVWYYLNSTVFAAGAGQASSTIVTAKLAFTGILNSMKSAVGSYNDTSLSFAAATRAETKVSAPEDLLSRMAFMSPADQVAAITPYLGTAGYYVIDHRRGQIWLCSKATVANDSASYSYMAPVAGSGGPTSNVNVNQWAGTALTAGAAAADGLANTVIGGLVKTENLGYNGTTWDRIRAGITTCTATLAGWLNTLPWAVYNATPTTRTEAQGGPLQAANNGSLKTQSDAFDSGTSADKASLIRDISDQYVPETLIDTTNVGAATNYYPSSAGLSMDGYKNLSIQGLTSGGVTTTIEVTNDDAASPDWFDITPSIYDWVSAAYAASYVDVNLLMFLENLNAKNVRIKSITSDATNAVQYNIRRIY